MSANNINILIGIPQIPPVCNSFLKSGFPEKDFIKKAIVDIINIIITGIRPVFRYVEESKYPRALPANIKDPIKYKAKTDPNRINEFVYAFWDGFLNIVNIPSIGFLKNVKKMFFNSPL